MTTKLILIIVAILVITFLIIGVFKASKLKSLDIKQEVLIQADPDQVFNMVQYLENFPKWSPFLEADPSQKYEVKGKDGALGAQFHWDGNGGKDIGYQEIVSITPLRNVGMRCDIQKPFKAQPKFDYSFSHEENGVRVTQDFHLDSKLSDAFFMWLFGAKKDMAKMNARGLHLLKQACEK